MSSPPDPGAEPDEGRRAQPQHGSALRRRIDARPPEPMKPRQWAIAGAFIGVLFVLGSIARGDITPGIVGGVLAGVLCFLVLRDISMRQRRRIDDWDRKHPDRAP